jgi:hypothetical protein
MSTLSGESRDAQLFLYQVTVSDLTYFKSQQWRLTNHCLLLTASLVAVGHALAEPMLWELCGLAALVVTAMAAGMLLLKKLQDSIVVRQSRLDAVREKLGLEFYETWAAKDKKSEYIHAIVILRGAVLSAGVVGCWLLLRATFI